MSQTISHPSTTARFVWCDDQIQSHNAFGLFRRRFTLDNVSGAALHLFAENLYRLWVNGSFVAAGPARFVASHPQYDSIDLTPWLRVGNNELLVEANHRGMNNFQSEPGQAGFIAWGECAGEDFATPGHWETLRSQAWDEGAQPYSFAQSAIEIVDIAVREREHAVAWSSALPVQNSEHWGMLEPRELPMPSMERRTPDKLVLLAGCAAAHRVGFRAPVERSMPGYGGRLFEFEFFVHTQADRVVEIRSQWLRLCHESDFVAWEKDARSMFADTAQVHLSAGWNRFHGSTSVTQSNWPVMLEVPADLILRDQPTLESINTMRYRVHAPGVTTDEIYPEPCADLENVAGQWFTVRGNQAHSPATEMCWDRIVQAGVPKLTWPVIFPNAPTGTATLVLDMGREFLGHVRFDMEAPVGCIVDVAFDEVLQEDGSLKIFRSNPFVHNADRYRTKAGRQTIHGFHERGGRYIQITVRGVHEPVVLHGLEIIQKTLPLESTGHFVCDDEVLNWTWRACVLTEQESLSDGWIDPWRERGLYLGDALVESKVTSKYTADLRPTRWALRLWHRAQRANGQMPDVVPSWYHGKTLTDYTLIYVLLLHDYWMSSGDREFIEEVWDSVGRIFASPVWRVRDGGLWEAHPGEGAVFGDWGAQPEEKIGVNGILNALRVRALDCASQLALYTGRDSEARHYQREAARVRNAFAHVLWDGARGCYAAAKLESKLLDVPSAHANTLAVAYSIGSSDQIHGALTYLLERLKLNLTQESGRMDLYFLHFVFEALYAHGLAEVAENTMRSHYRIMRDAGAWTVWETLGRGSVGLGSYCHGWSATAAVWISERILGVRPDPVDPKGRVLIAPEAATLDRAEGCAPHPAGPIHVAWEIKASELELRVDAPPGLVCELKPVGRLAGYRKKIFLNGKCLTAPTHGNLMGAC